MKRLATLLFLFSFLTPGFTVKSQDPALMEDVSYINSLLKANPYRNTFLEITFFYSIDVTPDKELVVKMDFDGPFKTVLKARISELGSYIRRDTDYEEKNSICWYCKNEDNLKENNCVCNEKISSDTEKESNYLNNICVMFTMEAEVRQELIKAFDKLFKRVLEQ